MNARSSAVDQRHVVPHGKPSPKQRCKDIRDRFYPFERRPRELLLRRIQALGSADADLVEIGCGRAGGFLRLLAPSFRRVYGFDPEVSVPSCEGNVYLNPGFAENLDLANESVSVITCVSVFEHLPNPLKVLIELSRMLRPGGRIVLLTPNWIHPPLLAGRLLGHGIRQRINLWTTGTQPEDTFPAFYRANSARAFGRLARDSGLNLVSVEYISDHPQYLMFSRFCYRIGVALERNLLNTKPFAFLRTELLVELEKPRSVAKD